MIPVNPKKLRLKLITACAVMAYAATIHAADTSTPSSFSVSKEKQPLSSNPADQWHSALHTWLGQKESLKKQLSQKSELKKYSLPTKFTLKENGVEPLNPKLVYDISNGRIIRFGPKAINTNQLKISLTTLPLGQLENISWQTPESMTNEKDKKGRSVANLVHLSWPKEISPTPHIELRSLKGQILFHIQTNEQMLKRWKNLQKKHFPNMQSDLTLIDVDTQKMLLDKMNEPVRLCVYKNNEPYSISLCSSPLIITKRGQNEFKLQAEEKKYRAHATINETKAGVKGSIPLGLLDVQTDAKVSVAFHLRNGSLFEMTGRPTTVTFSDVYVSRKKRIVLIEGYGARPLAPFKYLNQRQSNFWSETIYDDRQRWVSKLSLKKPWIYFAGEFDIPYRIDFRVIRLPSPSYRPRLHKNAKRSSYKSNPVIFGLLPRRQKILPQGLPPLENKDTKAKNLPATTDEKSRFFNITSRNFIWAFPNPEKGSINHGLLTTKDTKTGLMITSYYEMYRGYPYEASFRTTGTLSDSGLSFLGEVAFGAWAEDLFGWSNYYLSHQRWGVGARYFRSVGDIPLQTSSGGTENSSLAVYDIALKYRFTPGLWNQDESWGAILNLQNIDFSRAGGSMLGIGTFWARSLPKMFDDIFNVIPWLRHPKWVDAEFIYYVMPMSGIANLGVNYQLNFHGKIFWTKKIYGESGFGIKQYEYTDPKNIHSIGLTSFYGTVGLGINF